jgi:hypothetical protein
MKKLAKFIRIVTVAPISAIIIVLGIYFFIPKSFNTFFELLLILFILGLLPILSYPIQRTFHIIKGEQRDAERKLAFIFCTGGYILGALISLIFNISSLQKLVYYTYFFSGIFMFITNFFIKIKASGHMCGVAGPVAVAIYLFGYEFTFLFIIIIGLVAWSSVKLKRHKYQELIVGFIIPIIALLISIRIVI